MNIKMCVLSATAFAYSNFAVAVEPGNYSTDSGIVITPIVHAGYKYDDNIFNQDNNTSSSGVFTLAPSASFLLDDGINNYQLDVNLESGTFFDSSDDNYLTGGLLFTSHLEPSSRSRFDIVVEANTDVEARGTGITEGSADSVEEPLEYNEQLAQLTYEYGSQGANARVALTGGFYSKKYTNFSAVTQFRSFNRSTLGSTFFYSTNANTDAFIELKGRAIRYDLDQNVSRDSDVISILAGVNWKATELTSGTFKIGHERKDFDDNNRENFSGLSWEANVDWKPLSYSVLSLETSRKAKDPNVQGDYISESQYGLNWRHEWNEKLATTVNYNYMREKYTGIDRLDKSNNFYTDVSYEFKRWLDVSLYLRYTDQDSTNSNVIYDKNVIGLDFTFSL